MGYATGTEMDGTFTYHNGKAKCDVNINYVGLVEGEETAGWNKSTIKYALDQQGALCGYIRKCIMGFSDNLEDDSEELYQDLVLDLYKATDYDALAEGNIKTGVSSYVIMRLGYIIKTFIKSAYEVRKSRVKNIIEDEDGEQIDIFDNISSGVDDYEDVLYINVDSFLEPLECRRYEFGFDLFQVLYIHLIALEKNLSDAVCYKLVALLNDLDVRNIAEGYSKMMEDEDIISVVRAINKSRNLKQLEKYVYGIDQIKKAIKYQLENFDDN